MDYCNYHSSLIQTFSALLTPVLGITGAIILILQYYLQKMRWRLDLYDKRYPVFQATMDYLSFIKQHNSLSHDEWYKFLRNSKDKTFLFGKDVQDFIQLLYNKGVDFQEIGSVLNTLPVGEKRSQAVKNQSELFKWFCEQFDKSKELFGDYLKVAQK